MGLPALVFGIFLVLKLIGVVAWSWWWITSPLWISFLIWVIVIVLGVGLIAAVTRNDRPSAFA